MQSSASKKLYGKGAGDPAWPENGSSRAGKISYSIVDGSTLKVEGSSANGGVYPLKQSAETIITIVDTLNEICNKRKEEALDAYEDSLYRYLLSIMRRVSGFYKAGSWRLVERTVCDFEAREAGGFKHDEAGRQLWQAWVASANNTQPDPLESQSTQLTPPESQNINAESVGPSNPLLSSETTSSSPKPQAVESLTVATRSTASPCLVVTADVADINARAEILGDTSQLNGEDVSPRKALTETLEQLNLDWNQDLTIANTLFNGLDGSDWTLQSGQAQGDGSSSAQPSPSLTQLFEEFTLPITQSHLCSPSLNPVPNDLSSQETTKPLGDSIMEGSQKKLKGNTLELNLSPKTPPDVSLQDEKSRESSAPSETNADTGRDGLPISKSKGKNKRVAMISIDEQGLAAEDAVGSAKKRARTRGTKGEGLAHMLWDVLNEQKNLSLGKPKMTQKSLLDLTRQVLKKVEAKESSSLTKSLKALGSGWGIFYQPIQGLSQSEKEAWSRLKSLHIQANSH
ncbi:hypothetical protein FRB90_008362 [Tulasnella sp. 427]|nr:hypothetical protein FRB90_008362 [Tulasnella sp. 427]